MTKNGKHFIIDTVKTADQIILENDLFARFWLKVFTEAKFLNASDIHIDRTATQLSVRLRTNGILVLFHCEQHEKEKLDALINKIKEVSNLDLGVIDEAQDGAFSLLETRCRYRVALTPGVWGEKIVMRIIQDDQIPTLEGCCIPLNALVALKKAIQQPQGLICISGPTNSGKSTTLQAAIMTLDREKESVISIEDPVERILPGVSQHAITDRFSWGTAIKMAMRQDPDVIFVGEIRDPVTAKHAFEAAMTGHLVFTTIHTNSTPGIISRFIGLGVEPHVLAENILYLSSQRLLPKLCPCCKKHTNDGLCVAGEGCELCMKQKVPGIVGRQLLMDYCYSPPSSLIKNFSESEFERSLDMNLASEAARLAQAGLISKDDAEFWINNNNSIKEEGLCLRAQKGKTQEYCTLQ